MPFVLQIILAFSLLSFLVQIFLEYVKTIRVLLFSGALLAILLCTLAITLLSIPKPQETIPLTNVALNSTFNTQYRYTLPEYNKLLNKYVYLVSTQPTHRDLLLNLSLLYQGGNNDEKAEEFRIAARQLDPNNPLFDN
jgi:hypothetical protein